MPNRLAESPGPASTSASGRGPWRRRLGLAAGLAIFGFLAYALARSWGEVRAYDWELRWAPLVGGIAVLLVFYLASAGGYVAILERLHAPCPPRAAVVSIWGRSLLGRYVPGSVLMVLGRVVLSFERGVPRAVTGAAMIYEYLLSVGVAAAGALVFIAAYGIGGTAVWYVMLVPVGLIGLHPRIFGPVSAWGLRRLRRAPLTRLLGGGQLLALTGWYALTAAVLGLGMWLLVVSAAGSVAGGPMFIGSAFLLSFTVSVVAIVVPSGLGVREGVFALALAQNLPDGPAVAIAVGSRLVLTLVELVFIAGAVVVARRR